MNDDELTRLLPVPHGRDLPADRTQILKEHLMTELRRADPNQQSKHRSRTTHPGRLAAAFGAVGALITAIALAIVMTSGANTPVRTPNPTTLSPKTPTASTPHTAAQLLAKIADVAASQPAPAVKDSDFAYIRSAVASTVVGPTSTYMEKRHERQVWQPVANICVPGLLIEYGKRTPLTPVPAASDPRAAKPDITCPNKGQFDQTYRLLQSIPTEPRALLAYLEAGRQFTSDDPPTEIGDLIGESIVPPALAAALYRLAATLPGARLVPHATNATGQPGIGILWIGKLIGQVYRHEWIFDPKTLQYIGEKDYNGKTGRLDGESAIEQRAFVAKAGQLP